MGLELSALGCSMGEPESQRLDVKTTDKKNLRVSSRLIFPIPTAALRRDLRWGISGLAFRCPRIRFLGHSLKSHSAPYLTSRPLLSGEGPSRTPFVRIGYQPRDAEVEDRMSPGPDLSPILRIDVIGGSTSTLPPLMGTLPVRQWKYACVAEGAA